ncbi:MAG: hypothetical protein GY832_27175 [Chloroflexi bacterium]|nr:hypothetical protein [Chloroflexota bacterium]
MKFYRLSIKCIVSAGIAFVMLFNLAAIALAKVPEPDSEPMVAPIPNTAPAATSANQTPPPTNNSASPTGSTAQADVLTGFQADLFTSAAVTKYPIPTPSGCNGIGPNLALVYNSRMGNGPLSVGWDLQLGKIERSTKDGAPSYDSSDTFMWSSPVGNAELVNVGGDEYRAKIESQFQKFVFYGNYWEVWDKAGTRYVYGQDASTCVQAPYACLDNGLGVFQWNLSYVVDTYGNYMTFSYFQDQGQVYPEQIKWTGNSTTDLDPRYRVDFGWEERTDTASSYRSGALIVTGQRLMTVTVKVDAVLVRKYVLEYEYSPISHRSLLKQIQEIGSDEINASPPTSFNYVANLHGWIRDDSWDLPLSFIDTGHRDKGVRMVDINGDGLIDQVSARDYEPTRVTYINTGHGWIRDDSWDLPLSFIDAEHRDKGVRMVDINGDGLVDQVSARDYEPTRATYINTGHGWIRDDSWDLPLSFIDTGHRDKGVRMVDVNSDGLVDQVSARDYEPTRVTYINTGHGWARDDSWSVPLSFVDSAHRDKGVRSVDVNGDGSVDQVSARDYEPTRATEINSVVQVDLLLSINNGIGGSTIVTYKPSTIYSNTHLPYPVQTIHTVTQNDGMGNTRTLTFTFVSGYHDPVEREFRGFGYARATDPAGHYTENYFHQDKILQGRPITVSQYTADGTLYSQRVTTWQTRTITSTGTVVLPYTVVFPYMVQEETVLYDGYATPVHSQTAYQYDDYGNPTRIDYLGAPDDPTDDTYTLIDYSYNPAVHILNTPSHTAQYDASDNKLKEGWLFYDGNASHTDPPTHGSVTKTKDWLDGDPNPTATVDYDEYGNVVQTTNARGYTSTVQYDPLYQMYPITVTNAMGHQVIYSYEADSFYGGPNGYLFGQPNAVTDVNGETTHTVFDNLGRVVEVYAPGETLPTTIYDYDDFAEGGSTRRFYLKTQSRVCSGCNEFVTLFTFFDGLGRPVQTKQLDGDNPLNQIVHGTQAYNSRGLVERKYLPYTVDTYTTTLYATPPITAPHVYYEYDPLGRVITTTQPDGSQTIAAYDRRATTVTDANGHARTAVRDAFGRLAQVLEFNAGETYTTTYAYSPLGHLTVVTDALGNSATMAYDTLGRKVAMSDFDMGDWIYGYDAVGNLIAQTDALSNTIRFEYDPLNRLALKDYPTGIDATYTYDTCAYGTGRLCRMRDSSGWETYTYDRHGRVTKTYKGLDGQIYTTQTAYDLLGRVHGLTYPDGAVVTYGYDSAGRLQSVSGAPGIGDYVSQISYNALGQVTMLAYDNGVTTQYAYDPQSFRLATIETSSPVSGTLQGFGYAYDPVGNVTTISDTVAHTVQTFAYDDLDRLAQAVLTDTLSSGQLDFIDYEYNAIGNLTRKGDVTYTYDDPDHVHAVTATSEGRDFVYDANGNMLSDGWRRFTYNYDNRPVRIAVNLPSTDMMPVVRPAVTEFAYDAAGSRVKKATAMEGVTRYIGGLYQENRFEKVRHIFAGGRRLASTDNQGITYFHHGDHLGSASAVSDGSGRVAGHASYKPFGGLRSNTTPDRVRHLYTGQELDPETGLAFYQARYYDPELGRFLSPDTIVPQPGNPQSFNRYSYVVNNPLKYIDPTGHDFWGDLWDGICNVGKAVGDAIGDVGEFIAKNAETILYAVGTALVITAAVIFAPITVTVAIIAGAVAGGIYAGATGQNIAKGTFLGALAGGTLALGAEAGLYTLALSFKLEGVTLVSFTAFEGSATLGGVIGGAISYLLQPPPSPSLPPIDDNGYDNTEDKGSVQKKSSSSNNGVISNNPIQQGTLPQLDEGLVTAKDPSGLGIVRKQVVKFIIKALTGMTPLKIAGRVGAKVATKSPQAVVFGLGLYGSLGDDDIVPLDYHTNPAKYNYKFHYNR